MSEAQDPNAAFIQAMDGIEALFVPEIPKNELLEALHAAENAGKVQIANDPSRVVPFANNMREIIGRALEANVQPPYTQEERAHLLGSITTYAALSETAIKPAKQAPTPTKALRDRPPK